MGQIWDFFSQNIQKLDLRKSQTCPILGSICPLWSQTWHPSFLCLSADNYTSTYDDDPDLPTRPSNSNIIEKLISGTLDHRQILQNLQLNLTVNVGQANFQNTGPVGINNVNEARVDQTDRLDIGSTERTSVQKTDNLNVGSNSAIDVEKTETVGGTINNFYNGSPPSTCSDNDDDSDTEAN